MRKTAFAVIALCAALASPARGQDEGENPAKIRAELEASAMAEAKSLSTTRVARLADAVSFQVEDDELIVRSKLPTAKTTSGTRVLVDGVQGIITARVHARRDEAMADRSPVVMDLKIQDFSTPGAAIVLTEVYAHPDRLQIARGAEFDDRTESVDLIQSGQYLDEADQGNKIRLRVQVLDKTRQGEPEKVNLTLAARSFGELRRLHPKEVGLYLGPVFQALGQESLITGGDPRAAWQALAMYFEPTAQLREATDAMLRRLNSDEFREREVAAEELRSLGQPAALLLMKADRTGWSEEQVSRVDAFLSDFTPLSDIEVERLATNVGFLIDHLSAEDPALRAAAAGQLEKVLGKSLSFDPAASTEQRAEQVHKIRAELMGDPAQPTTAPATLPAATM